MKKIIIDTDPGIDDTMAIYLALNSDLLDVIGIMKKPQKKLFTKDGLSQVI